ncbi:hypothetical protein [Actinoplanes sp. NPDC026623]|uniref:hypothetical protein n=1 Tax=Actinoplanes sp. NPDC026623 TaxID=3155610 RepID=UPI00340236A9
MTRPRAVQQPPQKSGSEAERLGPALAEHLSATCSSGWLGGTPPLPEALLWAVIGDLDVIERLSRHAHQVQLPAWACFSCGLAWPCETARMDLLLDLGWIGVAVYCSVLMERAAGDRSSMTPVELWQRFLEWTDPPEEVRNVLMQRSA